MGPCARTPSTAIQHRYFAQEFALDKTTQNLLMGADALEDFDMSTQNQADAIRSVTFFEKSLAVRITLQNHAGQKSLFPLG